MQEFALAFGKSSLTLTLEQERVLAVLRPKPLASPECETTVVRNALLNPIGSRRLREIAQAGETACIVVGDMTRLWARYHVLVPPILEELNAAGIPDENITIVSATGAHRAQSRDEHAKLVGDEVYRRVRMVEHDCHATDLVNFGSTSSGTPVRVNRQVATADRVILTSGIVHHFLAGYGGGKKAIMPGTASFEGIMANHRLSLNPQGPGLNPEVRAGKLAGNPLSADMIEAARMVGVDMIVNSIVSDEHQVALAVAGELVAAHEAGALLVDEYFGVPISEQADLVVASCGGYPKDINFYQTYKTAHNMVRAMKKGGVGILLSESCEGIGNDKFFTICAGFTDNDSRERELRQNYEIAGFMGYTQLLWAQENKLVVVSSLPEKQVCEMGMTPARTLEEAMFLARKWLPEDFSAYIMPAGAATFPILKN
jgi:nickel-dependent lactate racemase